MMHRWFESTDESCERFVLSKGLKVVGEVTRHVLAHQSNKALPISFANDHIDSARLVRSRVFVGPRNEGDTSDVPATSNSRDAKPPS
jgi:hypothetical protein